ncbi:unnamed protein product [Caretta caretta]
MDTNSVPNSFYSHVFNLTYITEYACGKVKSEFDPVRGPAELNPHSDLRVHSRGRGVVAELISSCKTEDKFLANNAW